MFWKRKKEENSSKEEIPILKPVSGYKTETIELGYMSSLSPKEAHHLIGKKIISIQAETYYALLNFDDGSKLAIRGVTLNAEGKVDSLDTAVIFK